MPSVPGAVYLLSLPFNTLLAAYPQNLPGCSRCPGSPLAPEVP